MQPNLQKNPKPTPGQSSYRLIRTVTPKACRRCGVHCTCTDDEVDAGGPA
jgi:hypothetical protein